MKWIEITMYNQDYTTMLQSRTPVDIVEKYFNTLMKILSNIFYNQITNLSYILAAIICLYDIDIYDINIYDTDIYDTDNTIKYMIKETL